MLFPAPQPHLPASQGGKKRTRECSQRCRALQPARMPVRSFCKVWEGLNCALCCHGCHILLHTVVLRFFSVLIPVPFLSQAISACWRARCRVLYFLTGGHTLVTIELVAMQDSFFAPTKHELCHLQGTGCALGQVPGSLLSPGTLSCISANAAAITASLLGSATG